MDQVSRYREIVRRELEGYAEWMTQPGEQVKCEVIFDPALDHFQLVYCGWQGRKRVHGSPFHLDIIDGKVWIQFNGTDQLIADELEAAGVPKEDIVLGAQPPELRQYTGYGIG